MTLNYTVDQARTRFTAMIGVEGLPNPWWGLAAGNDCVGFALERLGVRKRSDYASKHISISSFRASYGWNEVPIADLEAGDLLCENWTGARSGGRLVPEHLEYVYSVDHGDGQTVIVAANTGPRAGTAKPRGVWKKTRPIDTHLLFGIRPPYKDAKPSLLRRAKVKKLATYLNTVVPRGIARTTADEDGYEGRNYWRLVQTWGSLHNAAGETVDRGRSLYGPNYKIDGITGPRTREVEKVIGKYAGKK